MSILDDDFEHSIELRPAFISDIESVISGYIDNLENYRSVQQFDDNRSQLDKRLSKILRDYQILDEHDREYTIAHANRQGRVSRRYARSEYLPYDFLNTMEVEVIIPLDSNPLWLGRHIKLIFKSNYASSVCDEDRIPYKLLKSSSLTVDVTDPIITTSKVYSEKLRTMLSHIQNIFRELETRNISDGYITKVSFYNKD